MTQNIAENRETLEFIYNTTELRAEIVSRSAADGFGGIEFIPDHLIETTLDFVEGFVKSASAPRTGWTINDRSERVQIDVAWGSDEVLLNDSIMRRFEINTGDTVHLTSPFGATFSLTVDGVCYDSDVIFPISVMMEIIELLEIGNYTYTMAWFIDTFSTGPVWTVNGIAENIPIVFSNVHHNVFISRELEEKLGGLEAGESLTLSAGNISISGIGPVASQREEDEYLNTSLIVPMREWSNIALVWRFQSVDLVIDPVYNRELEEVRAGIIRDLFRLGYRNLELVINDADFLTIIDATEDVLALLDVLYPVFVILSVLSAFILASVLTLQSMKTTSLLRVLGTKKWWVYLVLCGEQLLVCSAGILLGVAALAVIFGFDIISPVNIALYFGGTLLGATITTVILTSRSPFDNYAHYAYTSIVRILRA
jgi:hypothetical protein